MSPRVSPEPARVTASALAPQDGTAPSLQERVADLEFFVHAVAHDLRAPLRAINGYSEILQDCYSCQLDPQANRLLDTLCNEARLASRFLENVLAFSRLGCQTFTQARVDMKSLAIEVFRSLAASAPQRKVQLKLGPLPPSLGDEAMLRQALQNLLSNAFKFTERRPSAVVEITGREQGHLCEYSVRDNGIGFDPRHLGKLFQPFVRLHDSEGYEGTGLGLAIVQRIVQRHGGRIWARSLPDQGATFWFTTASPKDL